MVSYIKERNQGHGAHNLITVVMHEKKTDITGAMKWIQHRHSEDVKEFLEVQKQIPEGEAAMQYVWGIGNLLRGADCWFFESERYFGERGPLVQRTRRVDAGLANNQLELRMVWKRIIQLLHLHYKELK